MKTKILVRGPVLSQSGYGEQSRFALRALRSKSDLFDIYIEPIPWGQTGWIWQESEFREWMDERITSTQTAIRNKSLSLDIAMLVTIPNEFKRVAPVTIGYTAGIETTKVAPQWLQRCNEEVDKVMVVSNHSKTVFENSVYEARNTQTGETIPYRLTTPIESVWERTEIAEPSPIEGFNPSSDFNFLMTSQWGIRKNFDNSIKWWVEEFIDQDVGLILKTNVRCNSTADYNATNAKLKNILSNYPDRKCKVHLLHGDLSDAQMTWLYTHEKVKALVNIAHGEGFGLPMFEAAMNGLPIVTIGWSGQLDFLHHDGKNYFQEVKYTLQQIQQEAVWDGVLQKDSQWAFAEQGSYKMTLRRTLKNWKKVKQTAVELQKIVEQKFSKERLYTIFCNSVLGISNEEPKPIDGVSFCIPTNGKKPEKTSTTINSIRKQMKGGSIPYEIVLCGDVSPIVEELNKNEEESDDADVTLIENSTAAHSRQVAALRNQAADNTNHDTIVWLDDDIILGKNWMKTFEEFSNNQYWDVLSCTLLNPDGTRHWDRSLKNPRGLAAYNFPTYSNNLTLTSGIVMSRRSTFSKVRWDDSKLVYADRIEKQIPEDVQYTVDLQVAGYNLNFCEKMVAWHNDETYTEFNNQTLKKELITENFNIDFFPPACRGFKETLKGE